MKSVVAARPRKQGLLLLLAVGLLLLLLGLFGYGLLPQGPLQRMVETRLKEATGPNSSIRQLHVVPGKLLAEVKGLHIEGPGYRIDVPEARLRLRPGFLLGHDLAFAYLELRQPDIEAWPLGEKKAPRPLARPLIVGELLVVDGTVRYRHAQGVIRLEDVDLHGSIAEGPLDASFSTGSWERQPAVPLGPGHGRFYVSDKLATTVSGMDATVAHSRVHLTGDLGVLSDLRPKLAFDADLDLRDSQLFGAPPDMRGRARAEGQFAGDAEAFDVTARLSGRELVVAGWPLQSVQGDLRHDARTARSEATLEAHLLGGRARGSLKRQGASSQVDVHFDDLDVPSLARAAKLDSPLRAGTASGRLQARGDLQGPLDVDVELRGSGRLQDGTRATLDADAHGSANLKAKSVDMAWQARTEADLPGRQAGGVKLQHARITASGRARGALPPAVEGEFEAAVKAVTGRGPQDVPLQGRFRWARGAAAIDATGAVLGAQVRAHAELAGARLTTLDAYASDLDASLLAPDAQGLATFEVHSRGSLDRLTGTARAHLDPLTWRGQPLGPVDLEATARNGKGTWVLEAPTLSASGGGAIDRRRLSGDVVLAGTRLETVQPLLEQAGAVAGPPEPMRGHVTGVVHLEVPLDAPRRAVVEARLDEAEVTRGDLSARARHAFTLRYASSELSVAGLEVEGPGLDLSVDGRIGIAGEQPLDLRARFDADLTRLPLPPAWSVGGTARGEVALSGTVARPRGAGGITFSGASAGRNGQTLVTLRDGQVLLEGDVVRVPGLEAEVGGGLVRAEGTVPLASVLPAAQSGRFSPGLADLRLEAREVQLSSLVETARPGRPARVSGTVSGQGHIAGRVGALEDLQGEMTLLVADPGVRGEDLGVRIGPVTLRLAEGRITTDGLVVETQGGTFRADGQVDLLARTADVHGLGDLDLRAVSPWLEEMALAGQAHVDVSVQGPLTRPEPRGVITLAEGTLRLADFPQSLTSVQGRVEVQPGRVRLVDATGVLGGGRLQVSGGAALDGLRPHDIALTLGGDELAVLYPVGGQRSRLDLGYFKARVRAELALAGNPGDLLLSGTVTLTRGLYDADIFPGEALFAPDVPPPARPPSPLRRSIKLNLALQTENDVIVRNNLAQLEGGGSWWVRGDAAEPAPFGRLEIRPGGKVFLQTREFDVTSGRVVYAGSLDPDLDIRAQTTLRPVGGDELLITVSATGPLAGPRLELTSSPSRSEKELASLIATGRSDVALDTSAWILGEQAAALLTTRFTRDVARGLRDLGFDEVDIRPELLARERDPGARFTFGKQLSPRLKLIYSVGLNTAESQYYRMEYRIRPGREASLNLQKEQDGTYTAGAGQSLKFGGTRQPAARVEQGVELTAVEVVGEMPLTPAAAQKELGVEVGDRVLYWDLLDAGDHLRADLARQGYLEAVVESSLDGATARFHVRSGPVYEWRVDGVGAPPDLQPLVRKALFEDEALEAGRTRVLQELRNRGHLRADVQAHAENTGPGRRTLVFTARPGPVLALGAARFPGATLFTPAELIDAAGGPAVLLAQPSAAADRIRALYRTKQYLAVEVGTPEAKEQGGQVDLVVPIVEGQAAVVRTVTLDGQTLDEAELQALLQLEAGHPYDQVATTEAAQRLRNHYLTLGYPAVRVTPRLAPVGSDLELTFEIDEGERTVIGPVTIKGLRRTSRTLVQRQIDEHLKPGAPLDPRKLAQLERRLLDLHVFFRAVVTAAPGNPAPIEVELEESPPYEVSYDLRWNETEQGTALVDLEAGNLFGRAIAFGVRGRGGRHVREGRTSLHLPSFLFGDLTVSTVLLREDQVAAERRRLTQPTLLLPESDFHETGVQLQQHVHAFHPWELLYGYRFSHQAYPQATEGPTRFDISALNVSVVRDTRDSPLAARRGNFASLTVEVAPRQLGADFFFAKVFAQVARSHALGRDLTWAQGLRVGLAQGLGLDRRIFSERFKAGGATSLRGYATDSVGPFDEGGRVLGGEALLVLNQELRYMRPNGMGAVVFYDGGNVWDRIRGLDLSLLHSVGVGLRYDSAFGLLRGDVAFPLSKREGDASFRLYFGIGQAF